MVPTLVSRRATRPRGAVKVNPDESSARLSLTRGRERRVPHTRRGPMCTRSFSIFIIAHKFVSVAFVEGKVGRSKASRGSDIELRMNNATPGHDRFISRVA